MDVRRAPRLWAFWACFVLALACGRADGAETGFVGPRADHYLDVGGQVTIADIAAGRVAFTPAAGRVANYGVRGGFAAVLWLRLRVDDVGRLHAGDWILSLREPRVHEAVLYRQVDGVWQEEPWRFGVVPGQAGRSPMRYPLFILPAAELSNQTVYLRLATRSSKRGSLWLLPDFDFLAGYGAESLAFGILIGILAGLAVYLFAIGLTLKDKALVGVACGSVAYMLYVVGDQGFVETFLSPQAPTVSRIISFASVFLIYGAWLYFGAHYLRVPAHVPLLNRVIMAGSALCCALAALAVPSVLFDWPLLRQASPVIGVGVLLFGFAAFAAMVGREPRRGAIFLACWVPAIAGGLLRIVHDLVPALGAQPLAMSATYLLTCLSFLIFGIAVSIEIQARERELRDVALANMARVSAFADYASDSLWEAGRDGRVTFATGAATAVVGLVPGAAVAGQLAAVSEPETRDSIAAIRARMEAGEPFREELAIRIGDDLDGRRHLTVTGVPIMAGNGRGPVGHRGFIADTTAEVQRREREAQQQKMAALGQLAGGIAHEINNLLHPIVNLSRRVGRSLPEGSDKRRLLDIVAESAVRGAAIVAGVLGSVRPSVVRDERAPLAEAAEAAVGQLKAILPAQVSLLFEDLAAGSPQVSANETFQVLANLVANAVHAMRGAGRIAIRLTGGPDEGVSLTVEDNGEGMSEETRRRALEPFFTTKQPGDGTGLGLPIVYGIVRSWNATLDIRSEPGVGTRVIIGLPAEAPRNRLETPA